MNCAWGTRCIVRHYLLRETLVSCNLHVSITKIINNAMVEVTEINVKNPRTYVAHRSKIRLAKRLGQKDIDPLFQLQKLPPEAIKDLDDELSQFELPAKQLQNELVDEFHAQTTGIHQQGNVQGSSISSDAPVVPQISSNSSITASSRGSENELFQFFNIGTLGRSYGYFLVRTVTPIWYALSFAITCAGAIPAVSLARWVARIGIRTCKAGHNKPRAKNH